MLNCSNQAMRELVKESGVKKPMVNLDALTDLSWQYLTAETDLTDGKYSKDSAAFEAGHHKQGSTHPDVRPQDSRKGGVASTCQRPRRVSYGL